MYRFPAWKFLLFCSLATVLCSFFILPRGFGSWFALEASRIHVGTTIPVGDDSSLVGYLTFLKSVVLVTGSSDFVVFNVLAVYGIIASLVCYVLLMRRFRLLGKVSSSAFVILPALLYPNLLQGYVAGTSLPLILIAFICVVPVKSSARTRSAVMWVLIFISLSFIWHSAFGVVFSILLAAFFVQRILGGQVSQTKGVSMVLVLTYFLAHWFFFGGSRASALIYTALERPFVSDLLQALEHKGSLAQEFAYSHTGHGATIAAIHPMIVYVAYLMAILYAIMMLIRFLLNKKRLHPQNERRVLASSLSILLVASIIFMLIYFVASRIIAPFLLITLLIPLALASLALVERKRVLRGSVAVFTGCLIVTSASYTYVISESAADWHMSSDDARFPTVVMWISRHEDPRIESGVYSDAFTYGNLEWTSKKLDELGSLPSDGFSFFSIDYSGYVKLMNGSFHARSMYVHYVALYEEHWQYTSLSGWSVFEPIPPDIIADTFCIVLDTGEFQVGIPQATV